MTEKASNSSGLSKSLEEVKTRDGTEPKAVRAHCQFCGKEFSSRGIARHESKCPENPDKEQAPGVPEIKVVITAEGVALLFSGLGDTVALWLGDHWKLDDVECEALGTQWKAVLDAYFPDLANSKLGVLILASIQTAFCVGPRVKVNLDARKEKNASHALRAVGEREDNSASPDSQQDGSGAGL
jgi:hypothetical protein